MRITPSSFGKLPLKLQHEIFLGELHRHGIPIPEVEYRYDHLGGRKFRADYAWPDSRLLLEQEGGIYTGQAHGSVGGILKDIERNNIAVKNGYRVLRIEPKKMLTAETMSLLSHCLGVTTHET